MADIKQAAKWMQERKNVKRSAWEEGTRWKMANLANPKCSLRTCLLTIGK